jgi:hypothetical protein
MKNQKAKLEQTCSVIEMETARNWSHIGWAAMHSFNVGIGFQYNQLEENSNQVISTEIQKLKVEKELNVLTLKISKK